MKTSILSTKSILALLLIGALSFTACKKEASESKTEELSTVESTESNSEAEAAFDDVFNNTMGIGAEANGESLGITAGVGIYGRMEGSDLTGRVDSVRCFTIIVSPTTPGVFPKTVTINFGDGCLGRDGKLRKGKIITVFTGPMGIPGSKATTTFENHKIDSVKVEGKHEVTNNSTSNNRVFTTKVIEGKLTWNSGRWVKWSSIRTVTQIEGNGTPFWPLDDIFSITGGGRGENSRGKTWGHEVIEPLIKKFTCRWISKGVLRIRFNDTNGLLNFGDGRCDNKAELTVNGNVRIITLP
nr:hypothetical protein [uncultured Lacibacter sp.]